MLVIKPLASNLLTQGLGAAMNLIFLPLSARTLGIEAFGLLGLAVTIQLFIFILDGCNFMTRLVSREASNPALGGQFASALLRCAEVTYWKVGIVGFALAAAVATPLGERFRVSTNLDFTVVTTALLLIFACGFLKLLASFYRGCLIGIQSFFPANMIALLSNTLRFPIAYLSTVFVPDVRMFLVVQLAAFALEAALLRRHFMAILPRSVIGQLGEYAINQFRSERGFIVATLVLATVGVLSLQVDKLIMASVLSLADYGAASLATTICGGLFVLATPVHQVFLPRISKAFVLSPPEHARASTELMAILLCIGLPVATTLAVCAPNLAAMVAPRSIENLSLVIDAFVLYGWGNCVAISNTGLYLLYFSSSQLGRYGRLLGCYLVVYVPISFAAAQSNGSSGAGLVWLVGNVLLLLGLLIDLRRSRMVTAQLSQVVIGGLLVGSTLAAIGTLLRHYVPTSAFEGAVICAAVFTIVTFSTYAVLRWLLDLRTST